MLTGADIDRLDDDALAAAIPHTTVFARVSPEQKSRIIKVARRDGADVAFLGDGVNDAVALHAADVGISVESAADVAKDAADVVLLDKDLGVLADGVMEGRRIFANTLKYVLMATSSNFGNMFSAAGASVFLTFLPMLPSQILLNNLLYDVGQLAIPTDRVDEEVLARPAAWDIAFVRRFMSVFGPVSSIFDFATFFVMLRHPPRQPRRVPQRLVRRVPRHPDARRVPDPHPTDPVLPQPAQPAHDHHPDRCGAVIGAALPFTPARPLPRLHRPTDQLLPHPPRHDRHLPGAGRVRQEPLLRHPRPSRTGRRSAPANDTSGMSPAAPPDSPPSAPPGRPSAPAR